MPPTILETDDVIELNQTAHSRKFQSLNGKHGTSNAVKRHRYQGGHRAHATFTVCAHMKKFAANDLETDDVINSTKQLTAESFNPSKATPSQTT